VFLLVATPGVPAKSVAELIALAKSKPGVLSYSSVGEASLAHLAGLLFSSMAGVELTHIPYKSSTNAVIDLMEGRIDLQFSILPTTQLQMRTGKLRALAVTTEKRLDELPDVPTLAESAHGLRGDLVVRRDRAERCFARPDRAPQSRDRQRDRGAGRQERLVRQGIFPEGSTSAELGERVVRDVAKWRTVVSRSASRPNDVAPHMSFLRSQRRQSA
jgi:tripartite-type tricarboxylate transporter receptor subunit TctC